MRFFKIISLFFTYRYILKSIKIQLELEYNARVDNIYRIYTVLNVPENLIEEPYNFRNSDIESLSRNYILEYRRNLSNFLISKGLLELFDLYELRKVGKYNYLLIFGYSLVNTRKIANRIISFTIIFAITLFLISIGYIIYKTLT